MPELEYTYTAQGPPVTYLRHRDLSDGSTLTGRLGHTCGIAGLEPGMAVPPDGRWAEADSAAAVAAAAAAAESARTGAAGAQASDTPGTEAEAGDTPGTAKTAATGKGKAARVNTGAAAGDENIPGGEN